MYESVTRVTAARHHDGENLAFISTVSRAIADGSFSEETRLSDKFDQIRCDYIEICKYEIENNQGEAASLNSS